MIIEINASTQYEVETAKKVDGQIIAVRADGSEIVIGGDLKNIRVTGGEITAQVTAPCNIVSGEYVTIEGVLYLATENIPGGEPVIAGQNAVKTSIEQQLYEMRGE